MDLLVDRVHRLPRIWSNKELKRVGALFDGDVVNISAWQDSDKEGRHYNDYFPRARSYTITNYKSGSRGLQGWSNEIYLDLEADLPEELQARFDVVFNHTTLEHIYSIQKAFQNLCMMSRDVVIVVVPFLQQYHSKYGDYWRLTPLSVKRLFEDNHFEVIHLTFNSNWMSSVYIFAMGSRAPEKWKDSPLRPFSCVDPKGFGSEPYIGCKAFPNVGRWLKSLVQRVRLPGSGLSRNSANRITSGKDDREN